MPFRSLRLPAQTLRNSLKIMLTISNIWLCLFFDNFSILNKIPILGQAPDMVDTRNTLISLCLKICVNRKIFWMTDSQILNCVNHTI